MSTSARKDDLMSKFGTFSGNPKTEWIETNPGPDRHMQLLEDFSFTDPDGKVWLAPKGTKTDGASIPQPLWTWIGSPFTDDYRRAAVVHDIACVEAKDSKDREAADRMFYYGCRSAGCEESQAQVLYVGVRIGAWFGTVRRSKRNLVNPDDIVKRKFNRIAEEC
jgi:Protein of unknown function (DUF1353)